MTWNKYHAKKINIQGETFDSMAEARRWRDLQWLQRGGVIRGLQRQVKFLLLPGVYDEKHKLVLREASYIADFVYLAHDKNGWFRVVEDAKGMKTDVYKIKRKLMLKEHGIRIKEV